MKAKVKDIAVCHNGKRYEKDEELVIDKNSFNDKLFVCLDSKDDTEPEEKVEEVKK